MAFSLRDWQKAAAARMFRLTKDEDDMGGGGDAGEDLSITDWSDEWKVLVYDAQTRAIISPLLSVSELRALGVTLHMSIDAVRDAIPDVTAVYFLLPTPANVRLVVDDAASGRYRDFALHFAAPVPRPLLETMARGCVEFGCVARVRRIVDQFLAFSALEHRLFSLNLPHSYAAYAAPGLSESVIDEFCAATASSVCCIFATLGIVPVIVASRGGPAEAVARRLDALIRDAIATPGSAGVFSALSSSGGGALGGHHHLHEAPALPGGRRPTPLSAGAGSRPVLVLADRDLDLATPLAHAATYEGLVDDTVGPIVLNRVTIGGASSDGSSASSAAAGNAGGWLSALEWATGGGSKAAGSKGSGGSAAGRVVTLDADSDPFWRRHAGDQFPVAIEAHERELTEVASREAEIRRSAGGGMEGGDVSTLDALTGMDGGAASSADSVGGSNADLVTAIDSLPALLQRKKVLETHSALLAAVMDRVAARMLPVLYECEASVWVAGGMDRSAALALVADGSKGTVADRTRLAAMHLLTCPVSAAAGGGAAAVAASLAEEVEVCLAALRRSVGGSSAALPVQSAAGTPASPPPSGVDAIQQASVDRAAAILSYVRQWRATALLGSSAGSGGRVGGFGLGSFGLMGGGGGGGSSFLSALSQTTGALLNKAAAQVTRLVQGDLRLPLTRLMQAVMDGKPGAATGLFQPVDGFLALDPRVPVSAGVGYGERTFGTYVAAVSAAASSGSGGVGSTSGGGSALFRNAFLCVVGGISLSEHLDAQAYAASCVPPRVLVAGGTEVLHADSFLADLDRMGRAFM